MTSLYIVHVNFNFEFKIKTEPDWCNLDFLCPIGNALRAVGKFKGRKKNLMDLTMTNHDEEELRSGFYAQDVEHHFAQDEQEDDFFTNIIKQQKRRFSLKKFSFRKKRTSSQQQRRQDEGFNEHLMSSGNRNGGGGFDAQKGQGKMLEQGKSQENLIIESFINECMRESMRSHNNKKKAASENGEVMSRHPSNNNKDDEYNSHDESEDDESSFVVAKETTNVARSVTLLQNGYNSENRSATTKGRDCDQQKPLREPARRGNSDAQVHEASRKKTRRPKSNLSDISDITERQKRASQRLSNYYEKSANTSTENVAALRRSANRARKQSSSKQDGDYDDHSEHGSTLSAFALVPGTDLQRKLSQHGINDKASMDIIKQTTTTSSQQRISDRNKYPPPPSTSATRHNSKNVKRRSFHSVDNIYASSSMNNSNNNKNNRYSAHMITNNLQNSFSADDIDETGHLFKPLKDSESNKPATGGDKPFTFMITSTPREVEDVPEEQEDEEGMATYV